MLWNELLHGGYTIYFRHAEATVGKDSQPVRFGNCRTQRNLSETGKQQAEIIGNVLRKSGVPIEPFVVASPYCRAIDTAGLAFPSKYICIDYSLGEIAALSEDAALSNTTRDFVIYKISCLFELLPAIGQNRIIIGHSFPKDVVLGDIPYLTGIVLKPKGPRNGYDVLGKLDFNS